MSFFPNNSSPLFIDGELRESIGGTYPVINPANGTTIGAAADATDEDLASAIAAARRAFDENVSEWRTNHAFRAHCLRQLREELTRDLEEIRALTIAEAGTPHFLTTGPQLEGPLEFLDHFADMAEKHEWIQELGTAEVFGVKSRLQTRDEAAGVVAAITPWNFPHQINFAKIAPALAAGCTVILKAAPDTPWCAAAIGIAAARTDLPPGVLNIITSSRNEIGQQLVESPDVDLVSFTGSTAVGKKIMSIGAETLKRVFLELGGKSASIVLDDADLGAACFMTAMTCTMHAGQGCALTTRLVVPREQLDTAIALTRDAMQSLQPQDPTNEGHTMGPLINQRQLERVSGYVQLAREEGGTIECGGEPAKVIEGGWFFQPTLISGLSPDARVAQEEIFGPVLVILPHDGDDDAIKIANNSQYGLSGAVFSSDPDRIDHVINNVRTGTLSINGAQWYDVKAPFGGYKQSGIGREMGAAGFAEYLETKSLGFPA